MLDARYWILDTGYWIKNSNNEYRISRIKHRASNIEHQEPLTGEGMKNKPVRALLIEDDPYIAQLVRQMLDKVRDISFDLVHTDSLSS